MVGNGWIGRLVRHPVLGLVATVIVTSRAAL